jgi:hypothetical protein
MCCNQESDSRKNLRMFGESCMFLGQLMSMLSAYILDNVAHEDCFRFLHHVHGVDMLFVFLWLFTCMLVTSQML